MTEPTLRIPALHKSARGAWAAERAAVVLALAAAVLALAAVLFQAPAAASPHQPSRVSNAAEASSGTEPIRGGSNNKLVAGSFHTGSNDGGYFLSYVAVFLEARNNSDGKPFPRVWIHTDDSGSPGTQLARLKGPGGRFSYALEGEDPFTSNMIVELEANTTYWVVVGKNHKGELDARLTASDNQTGEPGWSIGDTGKTKTGNGAWTDAAGDATLAFTVYAFEKAPNLVDNTAEASSGTESISSDELVAGSFTTGSHDGDYRLSHVGVHLEADARAFPKVWIYTDDSGSPGTAHTRLAGPGNEFDRALEGEDPFTVNSRAGIVELEANTTYWVVVGKNKGQLGARLTASDNQTGEAGWSIGDTAKTKTGNGAWTDAAGGATLAFAVYASEKDPTLVSNVHETFVFNMPSALPHGKLLANEFTTGSHPGGYTLTEVGMLTMATGQAVPGVEIYSDSSGLPSRRLGVLPASGSADSNLETEDLFAASSGVDLEPDTTYWVVIKKVDAGGTLNVADSSGGQHSTGSPHSGKTGWSIGNFAYKTRDAPWRRTGNNHLRLTIYGTEKPATDLDVSVASLEVDEGDATGESYTVKLATQPSATVTVTVSGHSGSDVSPSKTSLTFTTANWDTAQTVTVTADHDADATNDTVTLSHGASGGGYSSAAAVTVAVTVDDDDTAAIDVSVASLEVDEGDASGESYTVKLATQPSGSVTVAVSGHAGTDVSLSSSSLTFTTANWDTAQTVTVTADDDADATNDTVTLSHGASGGGYSSAAAVTVAVTVVDDDHRGHRGVGGVAGGGRGRRLRRVLHGQAGD